MKKMSIISGAVALAMAVSTGWVCCVPQPAIAQVTPMSPEEITALVGQLAEARAGIAKYQTAEPTAKKFALALLLAGILNIVVTIIKRLTNITETAKKVIPWVALALAVPVGLLAKYGAGGSWVDAVIFAGAGPGAIVVQELMKLFKSPA